MDMKANLAKMIAAQNKGILAADESLGTIKSRFDDNGIPSTEENRRAYREMLFTTRGIEDYVFGVILFEETLRHSTSSGRKFVDVLNEKGMLPGIKVDQGLAEFETGSIERVTKGIGDLPHRLEKYRQQGAVFAKWRVVFRITGRTPTISLIHENANDLADYAKYCQEAGIIPIVEPEVLMDGDHGIDRCQQVTGKVLHEVFSALRDRNVDFSQMILKPNMVASGAMATVSSPLEVATATLATFREHVPSQVPLITFLSGGQKEEQANANLAAIHMMAVNEGTPWRFTFSFGRSLQKAALSAWAGKAENFVIAQKAFLESAARASAAAQGRLGQKQPMFDANPRFSL